jgi:hypothetical protein
VREPYPGHPDATHAEYWHAFERRWGFRPSRRPAAEGGKYVVILACAPNSWDDSTGPGEVFQATMWLVRQLGAKPKVRGLTRRPDLRPARYDQHRNPSGYHGDVPQAGMTVTNVRWAMPDDDETLT